MSDKPGHLVWVWAGAGPGLIPGAVCHCQHAQSHADGAAQWGEQDVRPTDRGWEISDEAAAEMLRMSRDT